MTPDIAFRAYALAQSELRHHVRSCKWCRTGAHCQTVTSLADEADTMGRRLKRIEQETARQGSAQ